MNPVAIAQAFAAVVAPLITLVGLVSRRRRLRAEIRDNLSLLRELEKEEVFRNHTPTCGWLAGKIVIDIAKLTGEPLGARKKPIPWGSVAAASLFFAGFTFWTYYIDLHGFVWYSVFPAIVAFLFLVSIYGMLINREIPPETSNVLPPGATPLKSETANEQVATAVALATNSDTLDDRYSDNGQIGVTYRFLRTMREGRVEEGFTLADENWRLCRVQAWLWNNRNLFGSETAELDQLATSLTESHEPKDTWAGFITTEARDFVEAWGQIDPDKWGAASRRRRLARDYDLVILAPVGETGGYFVNTATALPQAMTFIMHNVNGAWLVANHIGSAPPRPGWPPAWWTTTDPAMEALTDADESAAQSAPAN